MTRTVLIVEDDRSVREALGQTLELAELDPVLAGSFVEAKDLMTRRFDGVIVTDMRMPGRDGFYLLQHVRKLDSELPVILLTGEGDVPMAVKAIAEGAFDFLQKPCAPADLLRVIEKALKARASVMQDRRARQATETGDAAARLIFGVSALAEELRQKVRQAARNRAETLVWGEIGTGISKVAEVIHLLSPASREPFVKCPAAGLDSEGLLSALDRAGQGSLYLDEVTALPPATQMALLDHLESGAAMRLLVGSTRDIEKKVADGRFMSDLFYRLDMMRVRIPSIRERPEDIPVLFRHYVAQACEQANLPEPPIPAEMLARLMAQDWPGNARALMNAAMRFVMGLGDADLAEGLGLSEQMGRVERALLIEALRKQGGRATDAARALKLPRKTFYDKLARHGLRPEDYRAPD